MGGRGLGVAAVLAAAALWGSTGTLQALMPAEKQPLVVGALRLWIGAAGLFAMALVLRESRRGFAALPWRSVIFAGIAIALYNLLFFAATLRAGVGVGAAVAIGGAPAWVALYDAVVRRIIPRGARLFAQILSIAGAALLALSADGGGGSGGGADPGSAALGVLLAALAGAAYAAYSLATSQATGRAPSATLAAATFGVAAIAAAPALWWAPTDWLFAAGAGASTWPALLTLGLGATALSYAFYTWGLGRVAPSTAVTLALAEPLTAWLLASVVVGEETTAAKLAGGAMVIAGLAIIARVPGPTRSPD